MKKGTKIVLAVVILAILAVVGAYLIKMLTYTTDYVLVELAGGKANFTLLDEKFESNEDAIQTMKKKASSQDKMWLKRIDEESAKQDKGSLTAKYKIDEYFSRLNRKEVLLCIRHNKLFNADKLSDIIDRCGLMSEEMKKELDRLGITYRAEVVHDLKLPSADIDF